ncbi:MAG: thiol peroxidase [Desulfomonilaceae bacterium]|jgi:thiol peroxidase
MNERQGLVTFKGNPLTLVGNEVKVGDSAPDFVAMANDLSPVSLSSYKGKPIIISSVPSLDTPICDMSTRRFNEEAINHGNDIAILTVSMDLPFAQARWCGAAGVKNVVTLSDYKDASFGMQYGLLIKELRLLARAVFVIDKNGKIQYLELVPEIAQEPNYDSALEALKKIK